MSESSAGGDDRHRRELSIILQRCIGTSKRLTKEIANILRDEEVVKREEKLRWIKLVGEDQVVVVLNEMLEQIIESEEGTTKLPHYLQEAGAPDNVIKLISTVVGDEAPPAVTMALINKWHVLAERESDLKREVPNTFPESAKELTDDWPLNFINFCTEQTKSEALQTLLRGLGALAAQDASSQSSSQISDSDAPSPQPSEKHQHLQDTKPDNAESGPASIAATFEIILSEEIKQTEQKSTTKANADESGGQDIAEIDENNSQLSSKSDKLSTNTESDGSAMPYSAEQWEHDPVLPMAGPPHDQERKDYVPEKYQEQPAEVEDTVADNAHPPDREHDSEEKTDKLGPPNIQSKLEDMKSRDSRTCAPEKNETEGPVTRLDLRDEPGERTDVITQLAEAAMSTEPPALWKDPLPTPPERQHISTATVEMTVPVQPRKPTPEEASTEHTPNNSGIGTHGEIAGNLADPAMIQTEVPGGDEFVLDHYEKLEECKELLLPIAGLVWPSQKFADWPYDLVDVLSPTDERSIQHFIAACKLVFEGKEILKGYKYSAPTIATPKWILTCKNISASPQKAEIMCILYEMTWKEKVEAHPANVLWPPLLREKSKHDNKTFSVFMQVAEMFFELMEKFPLRGQTRAGTDSQPHVTAVKDELQDTAKLSESGHGKGALVKQEITDRELPSNLTKTTMERGEHGFSDPKAEESNLPDTILPECEEFKRTYEEMKQDPHQGQTDISKIQGSKPSADARTSRAQHKSGYSLRPRPTQSTESQLGNTGSGDQETHPDVDQNQQKGGGEAQGRQLFADPMMHKHGEAGQPVPATRSSSKIENFNPLPSQYSPTPPPRKSTGTERNGQKPTDQAGQEAGQFRRQSPVRRRRRRPKHQALELRDQVEPEIAQEAREDEDYSGIKRTKLQAMKTESMKIRVAEREAPGIVLRVAAIGLGDDETIHFGERGCQLLPMEKLTNGVYTLSLEHRPCLTYNYYAIGKSRALKCETTSGDRVIYVRRTSTASFHFDEAIFYPGACTPGQYMHLHLPPPGDEVIQSELLREEVFSWLHQTQLGWKFLNPFENCFYADKEMIDRILANWLKSLHEEDRIYGVLALVLAVSDRSYDAETFLMQKMIFYMNVSTQSVDSQRALYREIMTTFSSDLRYSKKSSDHLQKAMVKFFQMACVVTPEWLFALPLFYLVEHGGHMAQPKPGDVSKRAFIPCKAGSEMTESLKSIWKIWKRNAKDCQENLLKLSNDIIQISQMHPWMTYIYQNLLNTESVRKLILEKDAVLMTFQLGRLVEGLLPCIKECFESDTEKSAAMLNMVEEFFLNSFNHREECSFSEEETTESVVVINDVLRLLWGSVKKSENERYVIFCIKIASSAALWSSKIVSKSASNTLALIEATVDEMLNVVLSKIDDSCFTKRGADLTFFNGLLRIHWFDGFGTTWKGAIQERISGIIDLKWGEDAEKYLTFFSKYVMPIEDICDELEYCFVEKALKCARSLLDHDRNAEPVVRACGLFKQMPKRAGKVAFFENLFLNEFRKYHPGGSGCHLHQILKFVCEWPLSADFFGTFNTEDALKHLPKLKPTFAHIESCFENFVTSLDTKSVLAVDLNLIMDHKDKICQFVKTCTQREEITKENGSRTDHLNLTLENLFNRIETFKTEQRQIHVFTSHCSQLQEYGIVVDFSKLNELYNGINDFSPIRDFFTSEDLKQRPLDFHGLTANDMTEFVLLDVLKKSDVFLRAWTNEATKFKARSSPDQDIRISWKVVLSEIWKGAKNSVSDLTSSIQKGTMNLNTTASEFQFCEGRRDRISKEVKRLYRFVDAVNGCIDTDSCGNEAANRVVEKIGIVFEMKKNGRSLKWVLDFKEKFELDGEFDILEDFPDWTSTDMTINDVDENILKGYPHQLKDITQSELDNLQDFLGEMDLISWFKTTNMTNVGEIKVLYDLVTSSPGENPHETDRVTYLLSAAQGFSPLIFHLDEINCLEDLVERTSEVKANIERDPKIVDKWRDSARHLQWFTEKESLYGSDQKLCLRRAQEINESGVYSIGRIAGSAVNPTLENSIALVAHIKDTTESPRKKGEGTSEHYTLNELQDLQSKLMLIAGEEEQGQQDIQQFVDLFTTVKTLGEAFLNLVNAGCMLFSQWRAVIGSGPSKAADRQTEQNLRLSIYFMETSKPLAGAVSLVLLQDLSRGLRQAYEQWAEYIASKRLEHYYLNEYNIRQITYLCHQLAKTNNIASLPDQVLSLLSKNSKCVVTAAIQDALDEAFKINDEEEEDKTEEHDEKNEEESKLTDLEKKKRVIRILVNRERLDEDLAKASVQAVGYYDIEECNNWALLNQFDEKLVKTNLNQYEDENACALQSNQEEELTTLLENRSVRSLTEMIDQILKTEQTDDSLRIVGAVKTICHRYYQKTSVLTLQDYLSVEHLGRFLTILHEKYEVKQMVERSMNAPLEQGKPNLIVCPEQDILPTLLSLYMKDPQQPLPTTSEVLLCSAGITPDDVERFMRRAMCTCKPNGRPIFCLAFADKLKFDASQAIENIYNELKKKGKYINEDYQLVFLTSKSDHYINGCFEKYQIPRLSTTCNVTETSSYLKTHLRASHGYGNGNGDSLVKIVTSNRSGVGKSLFVNKLKIQLDARWYEEDDRMKDLLHVLNSVEGSMSSPQRELPEPLIPGQPNHIVCEDEGSILPCLLALFIHTPDQPPPSPYEVLLCSWETTEDELERFMRRAICRYGCESEPIFVMAYTHRLRPELARKVMQIHDKLSSNAHAEDDYQLVILSTRTGFKHLDTPTKFQLTADPIDQAGITAYLTQHQVPEGVKLSLEEYIVRDEEHPDSQAGAYKPSTSVWHKTTIRLLEKNIDSNHVLKRLYGEGGLQLNEVQAESDGHKQECFRNEDNHFVHFDLTPAVENGIERFMFNLLVLGSIQDDEGRLWNRQSQHLYVIEMTKGALNKAQISKNSILNMLPCMRCLSPSESLKKYNEVQMMTTRILQASVEDTDENDSDDSGSTPNAADDNSYVSQELSHYKQDSRSNTSQLREVLGMSGLSDHAISKFLTGLPDDAKRKIEDIHTQQDLANHVLMDFDEFMSTKFQRPYQYLKHAQAQDINLDEFQYSRPEGSPEDCIEVLQTAYGLPNPSWAQLRHFTSFLNVQLQNCEESVFCQMIRQEGEDEEMSWEHTELEGLKEFAVNFMIRMAQDFATPSLDISDQSSKDVEDTEQDILETHQIRRKWEEKCHPYVFFNEDRVSMSFINVNLNRKGDLVDEKGKILVPKIARRSLVTGLRAQGIRFGFHFEDLSRQKKLEKLRTIMGLPPSTQDPDPLYELTTENVLKILAIYMRMRCNIPVILMGETGCGKTRLVEFMSKLRACEDENIKNMVTLKIHGGVTAEDIYKSVRKANEISHENRRKGISTVLFYDEANTTTAIHAIKEVVCDSTIDGESFHDSQLQIVAACNPYKCLSENAIKKLENLGLGYRVAASETSSCLGRIPMRRLVYKVVALPPSMQPFVWDFGQLSLPAEQKYIRQMTVHLRHALNLGKDEKDLIDFLLFQAQSYMKNMKDECRYVSLRDVERCMKFFTFFHKQSGVLIPKIKKVLEGVNGRIELPKITKTLRCLLQTLGVCYHVSLDGRKDFRRHISEHLRMVGVILSESDINQEFIACQEVFLTNLRIASNIAGNEALRENAFLITICMELRIPLFLVGKPGSSKSLAKTIVADNMEGSRSKSALYRRLKQVHMVSYQCSALTDAAGIENVFKKASEFQEGQDLSSFTSVVVLDEIGLAEDSPNMPLKILHPLLECGSTISGTIMDTKPADKVGFVGISNWALDPAKMNRGIFLTRSTPGKKDLLETASAIMHRETRIMDEEVAILESLTKTYLKIYSDQKIQGRKEYFGLRDYYSLIKMLNAKSTNKEKSKLQDVAHAVQRNFSGGPKPHYEDFVTAVKAECYLSDNFETASVQEMITENLSEKDTRFLLLLTSQHSNIALLEHTIPDFQKSVYVIYGSGFPGDHTYTEICKNINRIKVCMETGRTVVLLNMTEVHESLYDALNQHYSLYGGQRYVDIGLGGHRLKCRVADSFRLIVLEQRDVVYQQYPIPLINRLEKHHLVSSSLLSNIQKSLSMCISGWAELFSRIGKFAEKDAFIGFHDDTVSSIVISHQSANALQSCKCVLLQSAVADAVFRSYKKPSIVEKDSLLKIYTEDQVHDSLLTLLDRQLQDMKETLSVIEVTSFSNILTETDRKKLVSALKLPENSITLLSLQQFDTQQDYMTRLDRFFGPGEETAEQCNKILLIQCPNAQQRGPLLACAKYCLMNLLKKVKQVRDSKTIVAFLHSTRRQHAHHTDKQLVLQHTRGSRIVYVDDLRPPSASNPLVSQFYQKNIADVLRMGAEEISQGAGPHEGGINLLGMLKDTVCQAMTAVKRNDKTDARNLQCINFLTRICQQQEWIARNFSSELAKRMADIYQELDSSESDISWIVNEASSAENLQEGGTFGKTLCLCLKRHLAKLLAFIISVVDENNNMNFLFNESQDGDKEWQIRIWLQFFEVFKLESNQMKGVKEFSVKFAPHLAKEFSPELPFCFALNDVLESQWSAVCEEDQRMRILLNQFRDHQFAEIIENASAINGPEIIQAYATDMIKCLFNLGHLSTHDHEALTEILLVMAHKLKSNLIANNEFDPKDSISVIFFCYQEHFQFLSMLSKIFRVYPNITLKANDWIEEQNKTDVFVVHALAMVDLLDWVAAYKIDDDTSCIAWMELTEKCKKIFHPFTSLIEVSDYKQDIVKRWEPISLLDLLLLRLLPSSGAQDKFFTDYVKVVVSHARRLLNPLKKFGFRDKNFLRIILNVLRKSYEDIKLKILLSWQDLICKMCRKAYVDPVELPCHHFICKECVDRMFVSAEMRRQCPLCPHPIPQEFNRDPAVLSKSREKETSTFKANCTSFFLEYLAQFCFSDTESEMRDQVYLFLHELVIGIPISQNEDRMELETLAIDLNITTRSNILHLLLQHDAAMVENEINALLSNGALTIEQKENLIVVIFSVFQMTSQKQYATWDEMKTAWKNIKEATEIELQTLEQISAMRYSLQEHVMTTRDESLSPDLFAIIDMCENDKTETIKKYMVKMGCQWFGTDWFDFISSHRRLKELIPNQMKGSDQTGIVDYWLMLGESYTKMRQMLNTFPYNEWKDQVPILFPTDDSNNKLLPKILAVANFENPHYFSSLREYMAEANKTTSQLFSVIEIFKNDEILGLSKSQNSAVIQLLILSNCIVTCKPRMTGEFLQLCERPRDTVEWFWPAMPVSLFFSFKEALAHETDIAAYQCPNGHTYVIGECTEPWYEAPCPECGETIGGTDHVAARGNVRIDHTEEDETGYQLKADHAGKDDPRDRMSKQGVAVVHFILHSCLLVGLKQDAEFVCGMIGEKSRDDAERYLYQKLQENIHELSNALGRNLDDAIIVMNSCLNNILTAGFSAFIDDHDWASMDSRQMWENQFREFYLLPVFRDLDNVLMTAQQTINQVEDLQNMMLYRLMHEIATEEEHPRLTWDHPMLWTTVKQANAAHLLQAIRDSASTGGALKVILESPDLHLLQHLDKVLKLQKALISKYQNQKDLEEVEKITFEQYKREKDGYQNRHLVDQYINLWNSIYDIFTKGSNRQIHQYLRPINDDSPITMALPSSRGRGRCAKLLAENLINIHNRFLQKCSEVIKPIPSTRDVEVSQLRGPDYILIDKKTHLLKMIRMHTSYMITKDSHGTHHHISYDIDALEKKVREKFVTYKPHIKKKSLPCIKYPQDIGIGSDWTKVYDHIPQEPLFNKVIQEVDAIVANQGITPADVCEGVRTVTHAISFLAKIKVDEKKTLQRYLEDTLLLSPNHMLMVPKSALVCHTLALYQRLMWHKAVNFVQQGLNPYKEALYRVEQCLIEDFAVLKRLKEAFERMDIAIFQQRLNEMLIKVPDFNPEWSLVDQIFPNLEFIDEDSSDAWFERIPGEICFKHVSHLFQLSVKGISEENIEM